MSYKIGEFADLVLNDLEKDGKVDTVIYIFECIWSLEKTNNSKPELDIRYIKQIPNIYPYITNEDYPKEDGDSWYNYAEDIFNGKYPLEKLPDHVRELAKELYYDPTPALPEGEGAKT